MSQKYKARLMIENKNIEMNPFVESFVASTVVGAVASLKGVDYIKKVEITVNRGEVKVQINSSDIQLTPFPNDILAHTMGGMISTLKDGDEAKAYTIQVDTQ